MALLTVEVDNLKCGGCAKTIGRRVGALKGVENVEVDTGAGTVRVHHDGTIDTVKVFEVLQRAGYPPRGTGDALDLAASYVSCAIGRLKR